MGTILGSPSSSAAWAMSARSVAAITTGDQGPTDGEKNPEGRGCAGEGRVGSARCPQRIEHDPKSPGPAPGVRIAQTFSSRKSPAI
jgi:hypothetical protein